MDGEVDAEAVVHRAMWWDGVETVTVKLEIGILKTVDWELLSVPVGDGKLCSDATAHYIDERESEWGCRVVKNMRA